MVATLSKTIKVFSDGGILIEYPDTLPPTTDQPEGFIFTFSDRIARCRLDSLNPLWNYMPRVLDPDWGFTINWTNAIVTTYNVNTMSKDVVRWDKYPEWIDYFLSFNSQEIWEKHQKPEIGWFDGNDDDDNRTEYKFNPLMCSCNLVQPYGNYFYHLGMEYTKVKSMKVSDGPDWSITPKTHPHLFIKQTLVTKEDRYMIDMVTKWDVYFPFVSNAELCIKVPELEYYPAGDYCINDKQVWVKSGENWILAEEMVKGIDENGTITADGRDRRIYTEALTQTFLPPWIDNPPHDFY